MKKIIGFLAFLIVFCGTITAQDGLTLGFMKDKLIFVNAVPTEAYTVVGKTKYTNSKKNEEKTVGDATGLAMVAVAMEDALKKLEKGKIKDFDAAIVYSPTKIELIKFNAGESSVWPKCNAGVKDYIKKKCGAKKIFFVSKPINEYDIVKSIEVKNFSNLGQLKMGKNAIDNFLNKIYERACKEAKDGVEFDAIMIVSDDIFDRGYFTTKTMDLIKFK